MRLIIALTFSVLIAAIIMSVQNHRTITSNYVPQSHQELKNGSQDDPPNSPPKGKLRVEWNIMWNALNRIIPTVFAGWAIGRLLVQFWWFIAIFFAIITLFDFILIQLVFMTVTINWKDLERIFQTLVAVASSIGFIGCISFLLGIWAGISRLRMRVRQEQQILSGNVQS